ncbi:MAG: ABC transporter ATP-binding protein [Acidobacteria bacterium]|nr:ABC transporter ATP-binding protein [Acidobacteriota bacterium]
MPPPTTTTSVFIFSLSRYPEKQVEEEVLGKVYDGRLMSRLLVYMRPYAGAIGVSVVLLLTQAMCQIAGPLLTKTAIDRYLVPSGAASILDPWLPPDPWRGIVFLSSIYLGVLLLSFLLDFGQTYLMQWTGQRAMFDLRRDLMAKLQQLDVAYFDRNPVGRLMTRVTTDVDVLNELFSSGLVTIVGDLAVLTFVVLALFQMSPGLTLILLSVMPLVIAVTALFRRSASLSYRKTRLAVARINAFLQEHVTGMQVLQLFNRERRARDDFDDANRAHMEAFKDSIIAYGWFYPAIEFFSMLALAGILAYGGYRIREGELSLGVLVAFFQYGLRFFRPIQDLSEKYNILQSAMAASDRIFKLLDEPLRVTSPKEAKPFPGAPAAVEFDHVWFAYKDEDWVLRDLTFRIEPGETIAVVGHTGAGKTTLTNLLLRFYDIQKGSIRIGGVDIREYAIEDLRRHFSIVLQDPYLFTGTIESNIRLGDPHITATAVREAAARVNLAAFVGTLPDGYDQAVRERGNGYSTGQKQLISFARALAHNPSFLILDEATSSVDTETEQKIRAALEQLIEGRTSIVIAHRLSTIQRAGRIFVMHKGQLRESGSHQQLLAARGLYFKLYQLQYKDQELVAPASVSESKA